jgi:hypothetical protein
VDIQLKKVELWDDTSVYLTPELKAIKYTTQKLEYSSSFRDSSVTYCPSATVENLFACTPYYKFGLKSSKVT